MSETLPKYEWPKFDIHLNLLPTWKVEILAIAFHPQNILPIPVFKTVL